MTASWACPAARQVLRADAPREVWLAERRRGIGGSDAPAILGLIPDWASPWDVWADKLGLRPLDDEPTDAMDWGRRHEDTIAKWFAETTGHGVRRVGLLRSRRWPWMQVSLDRLTDDGILECKTTSWRLADAWAWGEVPEAAAIQSQHALAVTGRAKAHVVGLIDGRRPLVRVIERDEALIADLVEIERGFWQHVLDGTEPPADGSDSTTEVLRALHPRAMPGSTKEVDPELLAAILARKHDADAAIANGERAKVTAQNELRQLCGDAEALTVEGIVAVTWLQNGNFNEAAFRAAEPPEVVDDYLRAVDVLDLETLKTKAPDIYAKYRGRQLLVKKGF